MRKYSQLTAMLAITKASLKAILRSPSAVVFSFAFPFIFILVFGFIGNSGGHQHYKVAIASESDTSNAIYKALAQTDAVTLKRYSNNDSLQSDLQKGKLAGIINIQKANGGSVPYIIKFNTTTASNDQWPQFNAFMSSLINNVSNNVYADRPQYALFKFNADDPNDLRSIREYKTIDFILPGQLGFSLLSMGVFGVAFMFFALRDTLVLKRFFATPVSKASIILGTSLARVIFQMMTAVVIIVVGRLWFGFTLIHGVQTLFEMLFLSFIGLLVFMGFGFIVSGVAKSDSTIPPFANLITMPQFLLGGTFFSIEHFPKWLQPISNALPLTHLNNAMRAVAFEGQTLWDQKGEIGILLIWGVVVYIIAIKVFRWES
jgi:ABC-2 type transport system permease protein